MYQCSSVFLSLLKYPHNSWAGLPSRLVTGTPHPLNTWATADVGAACSLSTITAHRCCRPPHQPARCILWSRLLRTLFNNYSQLITSFLSLSAPVCTWLNLLVMTMMKCLMAIRIIMGVSARIRQMDTELDENTSLPKHIRGCAGLQPFSQARGEKTRQFTHVWTSCILVQRVKACISERRSQVILNKYFLFAALLQPLTVEGLSAPVLNRVFSVLMRFCCVTLELCVIFSAGAAWMNRPVICREGAAKPRLIPPLRVLRELWGDRQADRRPTVRRRWCTASAEGRRQTGLLPTAPIDSCRSRCQRGIPQLRREQG